MAINPKDGKLIYHLTSLQNLTSILKNGLLPRKKIDFEIRDVANQEILKDREKYNLEDYTPFHFFCPTPFAGAAQWDNVDDEFIYIAISRALAKNNTFLIVPTHPLHYDGEPLSWEEGIATINWDLMAERDYNDHECKEVCMAECIYGGVVPFDCFSCIFVGNESVQKKVQILLKDSGRNLNVNINPHFFIKK